MLVSAFYALGCMDGGSKMMNGIEFHETDEGWTPNQPITKEDLVLDTANLGNRAGPSDIEKKMMALPSIDSVKKNLKYITAVDHVAGTPGSLRDAQYLRDKMIEYGLNSTIDSHEVLLSYPAERSTLEMLDSTGKVAYTASLSEDIVEGDDTSDNYWRNHTFNGYAPSGEATAPLIYANYGLPGDFDKLIAAGVKVNGSIVLMRYGNCFRGLKALNAQKLGALGAIIYSDPQDDGFTKGKTYDQGGPWRPKSGVQRGSVQFLSLCPGDPTRSYLSSSVKDVCGYETEELKPSIPVMPISWGDAEPMLNAMKGPAVDTDFQGVQTTLECSLNSIKPSDCILFHSSCSSSFFSRWSQFYIPLRPDVHTSSYEG